MGKGTTPHNHTTTQSCTAQTHVFPELQGARNGSRCSAKGVWFTELSGCWDSHDLDKRSPASKPPSRANYKARPWQGDATAGQGTGAGGGAGSEECRDCGATAAPPGQNTHLYPAKG